MAHGITHILFSTATAACALLMSCQQQSITLDHRVYPDAVLTLNQVDPIYRPYFAAQNGANYSRAEQLAAFSKARQTALGPMPEYKQPAPQKKAAAKGKGKASGKGKATAKGKSTSNKGKATSNKGKTATKGKATSSKGKATSGKGKSTGSKKTGKKKR